MSRYYDVLDAIKTQLDALVALDGCSFVIRKKPAYYKDSDTLPLVVISPRLDGVSEVQTGNTFLTFPVVVSVIQAGELFFQDSTSLQAMMTYRQAIFDNLFKGHPLSAQTNVIDCQSYDPSPVFDTSALDTSLDVSLQEFTFLYTATRS